MKDQEILEEIRRTLEMEAAAVQGILRWIQDEEWVRLVRLLAGHTGRIAVSGCCTSAMAARKIAHSLCCIERPAFFLTPSDAVHGGLGAVQAGDICILVSKGGNTAELLHMLPALKKKGAAVVAVTENRESALAQAAALVLNVRIEREPCRFNMLATASTVSVIAAFDAICIALMQLTGYTRAQFSVIHPGGAVGERLASEKEVL